MVSRKLGLVAAALSIALAVGGCASSTASIEQSWTAPNLAPGELTNVATLAPIRDATIARSAEDRLARDLNQQGIHATPGYAVLPPEQRTDREVAKRRLRELGFDGVVTMRLVGKTTKLDYYPTFEGYWGASYWGLGGPAGPETIVRIEINAYSLISSDLVWSALSKSVDPSGVRQVIDDVSKVAATNLAQKVGTAQTATR
jgi:hypothetical protein